MGKRAATRGFAIAACLWVWAGCKATYPKGDIVRSVEQLFAKELKVRAEAELVGKTLYVAFPIENMVTTRFDLPRDVIEKLETAMISISRIALSTDADVGFTVLQARDVAWGVETVLVRRTQDLRDLFYWKTSKPDFDERLVLETKKIADPDQPANAGWRDLTLPEFMGRWVASRISLGTKANPFMNVILGIEKVSAGYDAAGKALTLKVTSGMEQLGPTASEVSLDLLKSSVREQVAQVEKKYLADLEEGRDWLDLLVIEDAQGRRIAAMGRQDLAEPARAASATDNATN